MAEIKKLYSRLDLTGDQLIDCYVNFINKSSYDKDKLYDVVFNLEQREYIKNGYFYDWQRDEIGRIFNEKISLLDEADKKNIRILNKIRKEIQQGIVKEWHEAGKIDRLHTTHYSYKYDLPGLSSIRRVTDAEYRYQTNVKRTILRHLDLIGGQEAISTFKKYCAGYVNDISKSLNVEAVIDTKVKLTNPNYNDILENVNAYGHYIKNGKKCILETYLAHECERGNIFIGLDHQIPGDIALCLDYVKSAGKRGIRTVYRKEDESQENRIYITRAFTDCLGNVLNAEFGLSRFDWVYEDDTTGAYKYLLGFINDLNIIYGYITPEQGDLNGK